MRYRVNRALYSLRDRKRGIETIRSLAELDDVLTEVEGLFSQSHDQAMHRLNHIRFTGEMPLGLDPYSGQYREIVQEQYQKISGNKNYSAHQNEKSHFDLEEAKRRPYPYLTGSAYTVGEQLVAQGFIVSEMNLPKDARVVEMGPGWGNLTLHLALTGYETHAVEIDGPSTEILKHRARNQHVDIAVHQCDMIDFQSSEKFDAVIFYESFHHSFYPFELLQRARSLLKDNGKLILAGEPITIFPNPWSLRFDGLSLWSIRKYGWLELGFDVKFFENMLSRAGYKFRHKKLRGYHPARIITCEKI
ncbi:MAG: class I SAM-dependent methyltransferase [Oligoflexales bacterium]